MQDEGVALRGAHRTARVLHIEGRSEGTGGEPQLMERIRRALEQGREGGFDVALLDLGPLCGEEQALIDRLSSRFPDLPLVLLTGRSEGGARVAAAGELDVQLKRALGTDADQQRAFLCGYFRRNCAGDHWQHCRRMKSVLDHMGDACLVIGKEAEVLFANLAAGRLFRRPLEQLIGSRFEHAEVEQAEVQVALPDGETRLVEMRRVAIDWEGSAAVLFHCRDVTGRKRLEERYRRSEERFRSLFDSDILGIKISDQSGRIVEANKAFGDLVGYTREELLAGSTSLEEIFLPLEQEAVLQRKAGLLKDGWVAPREATYLHKDGRHVPVLSAATALPCTGQTMGLAIDLTEKQALAKQLLQSQKMEAVGQLAGGVAHDFNNLLSAIMGYAGLVRQQLQPGDPMRDDLDEIVAATDRAACLTRQLLAFGRKQVSRPEPLPVDEAMARVEKLLRRLIGEDIELTSDLRTDLPPILADPAQFEQVVLNLALNARDAMPRGGSLHFELGSAPPNEVVLRVRDTGYGMGPEIRQRIFEPFFTTKEAGRGTGLGLSTVYGIVTEHGGRIEVQSHPGEGSCFCIYFPIATQEARGDTRRKNVRRLPRGTGSILLVEDDDQLRRLAERFLSGQGYRVFAADCGEEALKAAEQQPFDLLLSDVVMPGLNGVELASRLRALNPDMRLLFTSGYTRELSAHLADLGDVPHLPKPFDLDTLSVAVREVLGEGVTSV